MIKRERNRDLKLSKTVTTKEKAINNKAKNINTLSIIFYYFLKNLKKFFDLCSCLRLFLEVLNNNDLINTRLNIVSVYYNNNNN